MKCYGCVVVVQCELFVRSVREPGSVYFTHYIGLFDLASHTGCHAAVISLVVFFDIIEDGDTEDLE